MPLTQLKAKVGDGGQEVGTRNQSKQPAESETFRNKGPLAMYTQSNPLHGSYHEKKYHLDFRLAGLLTEKAHLCIFCCCWLVGFF